MLSHSLLCLQSSTGHSTSVLLFTFCMMKFLKPPRILRHVSVRGPQVTVLPPPRDVQSVGCNLNLAQSIPPVSLITTYQQSLWLFILFDVNSGACGVWPTWSNTSLFSFLFPSSSIFLLRRCSLSPPVIYYKRQRQKGVSCCCVVCSWWIRDFRGSETWCFTRGVPTRLELRFGRVNEWLWAG